MEIKLKLNDDQINWLNRQYPYEIDLRFKALFAIAHYQKSLEAKEV